MMNVATIDRRPRLICPQAGDQPAGQRFVVEFIDGGDADALAESDLHRQFGIGDDAAGGHVVQREADVAVDAAAEGGGAFVGLAQRDDLVEDRFGLLFRIHAHGCLLL